MKESTLVTQLKNALCAGLPGAVVFKHHDAITAGIPDLSVTWKGTTTWLEVKYNTDRIRPLQHNTLLRLARQNRAYYVIYHLKPQKVRLVNPLLIPDAAGAILEGWDHRGVVALIRSLHLAASTGVDHPPILKTTDKDTTSAQGTGPGTPADEPLPDVSAKFCCNKHYAHPDSITGSACMKRATDAALIKMNREVHGEKD